MNKNSRKVSVVSRKSNTAMRIYLLLMTYSLFLGAVSAQYTYTQITKQYSAAVADSGIVIWTPATGKHIAITSILISTYGTTTGRVILWYGPDSVAINDSVNVLDTIYTEGVDQPVVIATFSPSATSKPILPFFPPAPIICDRINRKLKITTDAAISLDILVTGFEY